MTGASGHRRVPAAFYEEMLIPVPPIPVQQQVLHDFLLGGVGRPAYVRRDPPVHVVRFVHCVTLMGDYYALLRSRSALCLYGFCRMALQLLGTLERRRGALCPFAFLLTMEKLQLYSPRRLCYNSLVLGVSRCTGQEISACREASLGRSKLGRSKLGRNGDCSGTSAPIRLKKEDWKEKRFRRNLNRFRRYNT